VTIRDRLKAATRFATPVARAPLEYKHDGSGFVDGRHQHALVVDAGGGDATQLTNGPWSVGGFDWSPDGTRPRDRKRRHRPDLHRESRLYWWISAA
jgi:hypothetical protein